MEVTKVIPIAKVPFNVLIDSCLAIAEAGGVQQVARVHSGEFVIMYEPTQCGYTKDNIARECISRVNGQEDMARMLLFAAKGEPVEYAKKANELVEALKAVGFSSKGATEMVASVFNTEEDEEYLLGVLHVCGGDIEETVKKLIGEEDCEELDF